MSITKKTTETVDTSTTKKTTEAVNTSVTKKVTVTGNAKRILELEEGLADLKAQMAEVSTPPPSIAPPQPVHAAPQSPPSASTDKSVIKYLHDMLLLREGKIRPSNFKKLYANFLKTGKL